MNGKSIIACCALAAASIIPAAAIAAPKLPDVVHIGSMAVGLNLGTEGLGVRASMAVVPGRLNVNVGFDDFSHGFDFSASGVKFNGDAVLGGVPVTVSWYPFANGFSLDGGVFINRNRLGVSSDPSISGAYDINGHSYSVSSVGTVSGTTHFRRVAPYLGIGWGNPLSGNSMWSFGVNAGVVFEGGAGVSLDATGMVADPRFASDLSSERKTVDSHLGFANFYPLVEFTFSRRF